MAALTDLAETKILELLFENKDWANIGDATGLRGATVPGSFFIALFTASPTDTGSVAAEATYTGYARKGVTRADGSWTAVSDTTDNLAAITFDECTAGSDTITHLAVMTAVTGGDMVLHGALSASLAVSAGITPNIPIGDLDITAA
jgi:hypothetical protein